MDDMDKVCNLLERIGLPESELEYVYYKIYYWDFIKSLAEFLYEYGTLTPKQEDSLVRLVLKHTGVQCKPEVITHTEMYESSGKGSTPGKRVQHDFRGLQTIQLFDLPFESGSTHTLEFHPYNSHSVVISIKGTFYKIPLPHTWDKPTSPIDIKFTYKRTPCKGYMKAKQSNS